MKNSRPITNFHDYGMSKHYLGSKGGRYFEMQKIGGMVYAQWNMPFWRNYISEGDSVLDFGCGGGYLLSALPAQKKVGVEINPAAREEGGTRGLEVYSTLDEIPSEYRFTRVISNHALEHLTSPFVALRMLKDLLTPDGQLLLLLPLDDWRSKGHIHFRPNNDDQHFYNWTPQNLGNLLVESGFKPIVIKVITDAMPPRPWAHKVIQIPILRFPLGWLSGFLLKRRQLWVQAIQGSK